jgi:hypothetical protein
MDRGPFPLLDSRQVKHGLWGFKRAVAEADEAQPPLAPTARVAEILERFFLEDARLTAELLSALARCSPDELVQLFSRDGRPAGRMTSRRDLEQAPAVLAAEQAAPPPAEKPRDPHAGWKWDERGRRTWPQLPSSFDYALDAAPPWFALERLTDAAPGDDAHRVMTVGFVAARAHRQIHGAGEASGLSFSTM